MPKHVHLIAESLGKGTPWDVGVSHTLYLACLDPKEAKSIVADTRGKKARGDACPRIVVFADLRLFRRILTPLRLKLISYLATNGTPESVHRMGRDLGRDYHTVLKDVERLAEFKVFPLIQRGPKGGAVPEISWKQVRLVISPNLGLGSLLPERSSLSPRKPAAFSTKEWIDALENIEDLEKVVALGKRSYLAHWGEFPRGDDSIVDSWIRIFAILLDRAFKRLATEDGARLIELKDCLEWRGRFVEPALWEPAELGATVHTIAEDLIAAGRRPTQMELMAIAHDLEAHVRPNLVRLAWVAITATGTETLRYGDSQLDSQGRQVSIGYALEALEKWFTNHSAEALTSEDRPIFGQLLEIFIGDAADQVRLDDLRNWTSHRDYVLWRDRVILNLHPVRKARRLEVDPPTVTEWRRFTLSVMSLMYALKVMFFAEASARCGGIEPDLP